MYSGSTDAYAKKSEKVGKADEERAEKARPIIENEKRDPFIF